MISDVWIHTVKYLSAEDILHYRIVSGECCEHARYFHGDMTPVYNVLRWNRCFPFAKYANLRRPDHFEVLQHVEVLSLTPCIEITEEDTQHLKSVTHLTIQQHWTDHFTSRAFYLCGLKTLCVSHSDELTDTALLQMTLLEELRISFCGSVTDQAIRGLRLKILEIYKQDLTDAAFDAGTIEALRITCNRDISDRGILKLKHLKHLKVDSVPLVTGKGFCELKELHHLFMSDTGVYHYSDFAGISTIIFYNCTLHGKDYDLWKGLYSLGLYECNIMEEESLLKLPIVSIYCFRCRLKKKDLLVKHFGDNLVID